MCAGQYCICAGGHCPSMPGGNRPGEIINLCMGNTQFMLGNAPLMHGKCTIYVGGLNIDVRKREPLDVMLRGIVHFPDHL